jgi:hypothetical protein
MRAPALLLASLLLAVPAAASPGFPGAIAAHLDAPTPPCTVCHQGAPGVGTATTAFAVAMKARGLVPEDLPSLATALDALAAEDHDSNGNGVNDIDELKAGNDPNASGGQAAVVPTYGCLGSVARARPGSAGGYLALAAALLLLAGARRRRRAR